MSSSGPAVESCDVGSARCSTSGYERCFDAGGQGTWSVLDDCGANGLVCVEALSGCAACVPASTRCNGATIETCLEDGSGWASGRTCDSAAETPAAQGHASTYATMRV
ncbi:MAG: hypothetical protein U0165_14480 [Polyangiaceae bacterium]